MGIHTLHGTALVDYGLTYHKSVTRQPQDTDQEFTAQNLNAIVTQTTTAHETKRVNFYATKPAHLAPFIQWFINTIKVISRWHSTRSPVDSTAVYRVLLHLSSSSSSSSSAAAAATVTVATALSCTGEELTIHLLKATITTFLTERRSHFSQQARQCHCERHKPILDASCDSLSLTAVHYRAIDISQEARVITDLVPRCKLSVLHSGASVTIKSH